MAIVDGIEVPDPTEIPDSSTQSQTHTENFDRRFTGSHPLDNNPYIITNADQPGVPLVTPVFGGTGYGEWRRAVKLSLSAKNKCGFATGSLLRPTEPLVLQLWERCNDRKPHNTLLTCALEHTGVTAVELAACAAATAVGLVGRYGNPHAGWMAICDHFKSFCERGTISVALSYMAFISFLCLTILSASPSRNINLSLSFPTASPPPD